MSSFCIFSQYKDVFGKPNTGAHQYRVLNTPLVDYIGTILLAAALSYLTDLSLVLSTIIMFSISIALHVLFGVNTQSSHQLGLFDTRQPFDT